MKQCKIKFSISAYFIDEVELDLVPLDVCGVVFRILYMYMRDAVFMIRLNRYPLINDGKSFFINSHKTKTPLVLVQCIISMFVGA